MQQTEFSIILSNIIWKSFRKSNVQIYKRLMKMQNGLRNYVFSRRYVLRISIHNIWDWGIYTSENNFLIQSFYSSSSWR